MQIFLFIHSKHEAKGCVCVCACVTFSDVSIFEIGCIDLSEYDAPQSSDILHHV